MKNKKLKNVFVARDFSALKKMVKEAFSSVLPITLIVLLLCFTVCPLDTGVFLTFTVGALLLIVGMGVFTLGADAAMLPIGDYIGRQMVKKKSAWVIILVSFIVGTLITVAEPDLNVLAEQVNGIPGTLLIVSVGVGVGVFLVIAMMRTFLHIPLKYILLTMYVATIALSFFVPRQFVPVAFDSGGVTTGPMSVPFILSLGAGAASMRSDKQSGNDSFGITALCSIGPILSVMILGIIFNPGDVPYEPAVIPAISDSRELVSMFLKSTPKYALEVAKALLPLVAFYFVFMLFNQKPSRSEVIKILAGVAYTYVGLTVFLLGVNVGFMPTGSMLGQEIAALEIGGVNCNWVIIPLGMVIGYFVVMAEPAVHVLKKQVEEITQGAIPGKALSLSLGAGVAISIGLAMTRIYFDFPIMYILIPGYSIALILMFFVPDIFTAIAFDSGGVASGAMATSFVLPLAIGFCSGIGGDVAANAFGVVALIAMMPIITIQILGVVYKIKTRKANVAISSDESEEIIG